MMDEEIKNTPTGNDFIEMLAKGYDALNMIFDLKPDLCVIDLMMPNMDGYELCRKLRQYYENTPILMLTAQIGSITIDKNSYTVGGEDIPMKEFELLSRGVVGTAVKSLSFLQT